MRDKVFLTAFIMSVLFTVYANGQNTAVGWHTGKTENFGVNINRAMEKLKDSETHEIIVALIDTGVDTDHKELKGAFWVNPGEMPNNGIDDDANGYIDDVNGWNFLGSADGQYDLASAGTEAYREYKRLRPKYKDVDPVQLGGDQKDEYAYYKKLEAETKIASYIMYTSQLAQIAEAFRITDSILTAQFPDKKITVGDIAGLNVDSADERVDQAIQIAAAQSMIAGDEALWQTVFNENISKYEIARQRVESLDDLSADPRLRIGDDLSDFDDLNYGNNHTYLNDDGQGTVHAGIIAAKGINDHGIKGIFPHARIMILRAYPQGEEYDKDIAASIRYAVDNGARIINIGFCKTISPHAAEVTKALEYAAANDVLIVRAAGDSRLDLDKTRTFPSPIDMNGSRLRNMIIVGASTGKGEIATFSNYGAESVDLLAPGSEIASTSPDDEYAWFEGSSISAAIVSGIAAMLRAYFPELSAAEVREILIGSVSGAKIADADRAVELALEIQGHNR